MSNEKESVSQIPNRWMNVWEIHKQCDNLPHSRLSAFTTLQAFSIGAYTALTVARFGVQIPPERIFYIEAGRYNLIAFGIITAIFGWLVTFPMLVRIRFLNGEYLCNPNWKHQSHEVDFDIKTIFSEYMYDSLTNKKYNRLFYNQIDMKKVHGIAKLWLWYGHIIPFFLPVFEVTLWVIFATLQGFGILSSFHAVQPTRMNVVI